MNQAKMKRVKAYRRRVAKQQSSSRKRFQMFLSLSILALTVGTIVWFWIWLAFQIKEKL
jgi:cell division septal protein FtsQ